ncbi:MAG: DMT family transporter [Candidatus Eremiobacteraeota bacterium]|nr:DMT family transporter [Candidatus Eremiobacteraeota bacterium]
MTARDWSILVLLSVIWGGSFFFYRILAEAIAPPVTVFVRLLLASFALLVVLRASGRSLPTGLQAWFAFAVMGVLNNIVPFTLIAWAEIRIGSGLASILNATTPIFAVVLAHFLSGERLRANRALGAAFGLAGVAVLLGPAALAGLNLTDLAQLAVLAASLSYSMAGLFARRFARMGIEPLVAATGQLCASAVLSVIPALAVPHALSALTHASAGTWLALAGLALPCTAFAYVLYFGLLARVGPTNVMLVTLLTPVSALALGALFLGERLTPGNALGMAIIFAGLAIIDGRALGAWRSWRSASSNEVTGKTVIPPTAETDS